MESLDLYGKSWGWLLYPPRKVHSWQTKCNWKPPISRRENACQEWGCVQGKGAVLMQVYLGHAAQLGYWGSLENALDD